MVSYTVLLTSMVATMGGFASASNCKHGIAYCGYNLLHKGNYFSDIYNSLVAAGQKTDDSHVVSSLFYCKGDDDIPFIKYCADHCIDGGSGKSDFC